MEPGILQAVLDTLEHVAETTSDGQARGTAVGLFATVQRFCFLVCLCTLTPVLAVLNNVSERLRKKISTY